ncbi:hypothetical protein GWI33_010666 [Rhynchophorus ferrugineus]|uniref:DNA/RNA non-specific endonuclease domain-containing protein n=1 Tax=Rhynchophorus ferrugineus TaxID=354439 RepID=A0A834J1R7_RHYFE|nr:hypothetical protein GWI33_010666 [Rhynchophorus ferrugineus]
MADQSKQTKAECQVDPLTLRNVPLILDKNRHVMYPLSRSNKVTLNSGEIIQICCSGNNILYNNKLIKSECISIGCLADDGFMFNGDSIEFDGLKCHQIPSNIIKYTNKTCGGHGSELVIGYDLKQGFITQITICFDNINLTPIYAHHTIVRSIGYRDSNVPRIYFQDNGFYTLPVTLDYLYQKDNQRRIVNALVQIDENSDKYVRRSGDLFINRGHLAAKGDFVYAFQQMATFHYPNSSPQWASFNGGNWNEVEISVRGLASSREIDLEIYTGVWGTMTLPNTRTNCDTDVYLFTSSNKQSVPVPELFWKVVVDARRRSGVAIIGVNNPYDIAVSRHVICDDISEKISWFTRLLNAQKKHIEFGYIYACSVTDFGAVVKYLPVLDIDNLLL